MVFHQQKRSPLSRKILIQESRPGEDMSLGIFLYHTYLLTSEVGCWTRSSDGTKRYDLLRKGVRSIEDDPNDRRGGFKQHMTWVCVFVAKKMGGTRDKWGSRDQSSATFIFRKNPDIHDLF